MKRIISKSISIFMITLMIIPLTWQVYADEIPEGVQETVQNEVQQPDTQEAEEASPSAEPAAEETALSEETADPEPSEPATVDTPSLPDETETVPDETEIVPDETEIVPDETEIVPEETEIVPDETDKDADAETAGTEPAEPQTGMQTDDESYETAADAGMFAEETRAAKKPAAAAAGATAQREKKITIDGTSLDGSEDSSGNGWTYEKDSGRIVLRDFTGGADITSDGMGVEIVSTGFNRLGTLSCDGDINVIGTGVLLVDKVEMAEGCSFNLLPLREYYDENEGGVAVFLLQEDGSYMLVNGKVKGIIDEKVELPEDVRLVLPAESMLELQAYIARVETDEDGNKTIIRDASGYSMEDLYNTDNECYGGHLLVGDLTLYENATIRNNNLGEAIIAGIIVGGNLINEGLISGGSVTVVQKDSGTGGLYSGSGTIEDSFITLRTGQTMSINIKDSVLNLEQGEYKIEQLGLSGSSELYYGGNLEINSINGDSESSLNVYSFDISDNLKLTGAINRTAVVIKSGVTELAKGMKFLNEGTVSNEKYGSQIFNYSDLDFVSDGISGPVFLGPENIPDTDAASIPVVSFYLHKTVNYNWNIELRENKDEGQGYTELAHYNASRRQITYRDLINYYFPEGTDFLEDGQSIIFEVLRYKDEKLSMTILGDNYEQETDPDGVFLIRLAYLDPWSNQHGGTTATTTRASQTGTGNIGGNPKSIITGTGLTRFSSDDPDPDPPAPDPDPDPPAPDPDPDPPAPDPDPDPPAPDPNPDPPAPDPVRPDPDPLKPDPVRPDPDPLKPDPVRPAKEYHIAAVTAAGDALALRISEFDLNAGADDNAVKIPCYNLSAYINGVQVSRLPGSVTVEMEYVLPEDFRDKTLYAVFASEDEVTDEILTAVKAEYDEETGILSFETSQTGEFVIAAVEFDGEEFSPEFYDELKRTDEVKLFIKYLKEKKDDA